MRPNMYKNGLTNEPAPRFERVTPTQSPEPGVPSSGHTSGEHATNELVSVVYEELRTLAHHRMGAERADHTLQPTALVHEVYLRLVEGRSEVLVWTTGVWTLALYRERVEVRRETIVLRAGESTELR